MDFWFRKHIPSVLFLRLQTGQQSVACCTELSSQRVPLFERCAGLPGVVQGSKIHWKDYRLYLPDEIVAIDYNDVENKPEEKR